MKANSLLAGIKVVDLSRIISGPFATQILAEFGADVIKVERPPVGDESRGYLRGTVDGVAISPLFATLNANKRSVCLDLKTDAGREVLLALADEADVIIHNFRPGVAEKLGIDAKTLMERRPDLVYCNISGFGDSGPLQYKAANDIAGQAYGGLMSLIGEPDGAPIRCPVPIADINAGFNAAVGILGALVGRLLHGGGSVVQTSLLESVMGMMGQYVTDQLVTGEPVPRLGSKNRFGQPNQAFATSDGHIVIAAVNEAMWKRCVLALGDPTLGDDPRFLTQPDRTAHQDELAAAIEVLTRPVSSAELIRRLEANSVSCSPINDITALTKDEQVAELGMITSVDYYGSSVPVVASQVRIDGERTPRGEVPTLGRDTRDVLAAFDFTEARIDALVADRTVFVADDNG